MFEYKIRLYMALLNIVRHYSFLTLDASESCIICHMPILFQHKNEDDNAGICLY